MSTGRRVVIVGIGFRSPIGHSLPELRESLVSSRSGIRAIPEWGRIQKLRTRVGGVCDGIDETAIPRKFRRTMGRVGVLASLAAMDAVADSGLSEEVIASEACGISFGSTQGSSQAIEEDLGTILRTGSLVGVQASGYLRWMSHTCAANLSVQFRAKGPVIASCTACVSGSQGVGFGYEAIRAGRAELMITGGAEELHFMDAGVFDILLATSTRYNDRPHLTPRPFDVDRDGLVVGEGGACLILEEFERARARGARIYAEVRGYATNSDGEHLTNPSAEGMQAVMALALRDAGLAADQVQYINAHATATAAGDTAEALAVHRMFGTRVPVSGLKGYTGHTLGACGAFESIATILMMNDGFIAPTRNLVTPDPMLAPLGHVIGSVREADISIAMNNNFAFGGINTSLIFTRV